MSWKLDAACRNLPPDWFYRRDWEPEKDWEQRQARAKSVCVVCPVRMICLEQAWINREDGTDSIWGGLNDRERRAERRRQARERRSDPAAHPATGTGDVVPGVRPSLN